ncbi:MAG: hypothetical protein ACRBFS_06495 [Aureispira sp.]
MAFKLKKRIHEILDMDFETYAKFLKKETQRAAKFGVLDAVVCSDHQFSDGKVSTLVLMGAFVGDLANFYKKNKTALGFAKGKCYFEDSKEGCTLHLVLEAGRGKPDKISKAGRKLWAKTKLLPTFHKDKLPEFAPLLEEVNIGEEDMQLTADQENDQQRLAQVSRQYHKAKKALQALVLPLLSKPDTPNSAFTNQHFVIAKAALKANSSWTNKIAESTPQKQEKFAEQQQKLITEYPKLKRIATKIKQALMASNTTDIHSTDSSLQLEKNLDQLNKGTDAPQENSPEQP